MDIHLLERLKDIVRSAGTTVRSAQDAAMGIREKSSHVDLVTLYDPMVQEFLRSRLMTLLTEAGFLGEEDATHDIAGRRQLFIVDPIDGTMNFIRGLHHSSISVALAVDGVVTHAVVYNPYYDEMFSAQRGKGAWLNGQRLHVTQHAVHDSLVLFGSAIYYRETIPETLRFVEALLPNCLDFRRGGSAALDCCYVAAGRADLFFECKPGAGCEGGGHRTEGQCQCSQNAEGTGQHTPHGKVLFLVHLPQHPSQVIARLSACMAMGTSRSRAIAPATTATAMRRRSQPYLLFFFLLPLILSPLRQTCRYFRMVNKLPQTPTIRPTPAKQAPTMGAR